MTDLKTQLRPLISLYCRELEQIDAAEYENYAFSDEYKRKMSELLKSRKKKHHIITTSAIKKLILIAVAAILFGIVTAIATTPNRQREATDFIIEETSTMSMVKSKHKETHKEVIEYEYTFDLPEGYHLCEEQSVKTDTYIIQTYHYNEDKNEHITFSQDIPKYYSAGIDNERSIAIEKEDKYGNPILVYTVNNTDTIILWDTGEYLLELIASMSEEELMEIYYTVK